MIKSDLDKIRWR